jgi:hypothetical protein
MSARPRPPARRGGAPLRARRRWVWMLGATGLLLAGAVAVVLHSPWLSVREIEIVGASHADVGGRLAAAGVGRGALMIWLRPGEIEEAVRGDPWVREVRVERIFPGRLVVEVLEHTPALWVGGEDAWMLVARAGAVVEVAGTPGEGLLRAEVNYPDYEAGERPEEPEWDELVSLALALSPQLAAQAWVTSEGGELWVEAGGHRARLGRAEDLADKGRALETLLAGDLPDGAIIDLVAPTRPAISVPGSTAQSAGQGEGDGEGQPVVEGEDGG